MDIGFLTKHLDELLDRAVSSGIYPSVQLLVLQGKEGREVYHKAIGLADVEHNVPVARDTIYRMFSSSKNVTGVASAMCAERGLLSRRAFAYDYIPALREVKVGEERRDPVRHIYVTDVLGMTTGFSYDYDWSKARPGLGTLDFVSDLARTVPLRFDPGDRWMYGYSADIAGGLVEAVTGKRYGDFLRQEIFEPLGMRDTGFVLPDSKRDRLAAAYSATEDTRHYRRWNEAGFFCGMRDYRAETVFDSGGAGLYSTIDDWANFSRMLLAGGTYDGHRLLTGAGMRAMLSNLLSPHQARSFNWFDCEGHGYSHFFHVKREGVPHSDNSSAGTFGWGGYLGTQSFVDPVLQTCGILLVQRSGEDPIKLRDCVRNIICSAASA